MFIDFHVGNLRETVNIPENNLVAILEPKLLYRQKNFEELIKNTLDHPIKSPKLEELVNSKSKISFVVDDITRPTPTKFLISFILNGLKDIGINKENILITIGNGLHRKSTETEKEKILGRDILEEYDVQDNDAFDLDKYDNLGFTSNGTPILINKRITRADLVITLGVIKPHAFAGFTGGAKSIVPGVAHRDTILKNHSYENIEYPKGILGSAENVPRKDMEEIAKKIPIFMLNVILDSNNNILFAFAGDIVSAHREGVKAFKEISEFYISEQADVVIVESSYTSSFNLYQALFGGAVALLTESPIVKKGGMIILYAPCSEGIGASIIENLVPKFYSPEEILDYLKNSTPCDGQWAVQHLAFFLTQVELGIVTKGLSKAIVERLKMRYFESLKDAISYALRKYGENMRITIIKNPDFIIPKFLNKEVGINH